MGVTRQFTCGLLILALGGTACTASSGPKSNKPENGEADPITKDRDDDPDLHGQPNGDAPDAVDNESLAETPEGVDKPVLPGVAPRLVRLSHSQWESSTADLFGIPAPTDLTAQLRTDRSPVGGHYYFDHHAESLDVDAPLWNSYAKVTATLADRVIADSKAMDRIGAGQSKEDFIKSFGLRAWRRPISDSEQSQLADVYEAGPALYPDLPATIASVRHLIEGLLLSPYFLYRVETSAGVSNGVIPLNDWEIASRISYAFWNSMPDDALFDEAKSGGLSSVADIRKAADRVLSNDRTKKVFGRFHSQLFAWIKLRDKVAQSSAEVAQSALRESELFVESTLLDNDGSFKDFLTSTKGVIDSNIADLYVLPRPDGNTFAQADLSDINRPGLFTRILFLAGIRRLDDPDIIHRGIQIAQKLLCIDVPPPPPDALDDLPEATGATNRERISSLTSAPKCAGCHDSLINPYGFVFEGFAADGKARDTENGVPVNTATSLLIDGDKVDVSGPLDLMNKISSSKDAHSCYVKNWMTYLTGRRILSSDATLVKQLQESSLSKDASVKSILLDLVSSRAFLTRALDVTP